MSNRFFIYSFFVPEFIEAQRTSFLQLLKEDIPAELEKHNPIELNVQAKSTSEYSMQNDSTWIESTLKKKINCTTFYLVKSSEIGHS